MTEALIGDILTGVTVKALDEAVDTVDVEVEVETGCAEIVVELIGFIVVAETVLAVLRFETVEFVVVVVVAIGTTVLEAGCEM